MTKTKVDDLTGGDLKYWACIAAGAVKSDPWWELRWPGSMAIFNPTEEHYHPHKDPRFGYHLKLRNAKFQVVFKPDEDTKLKFVPEYDHDRQTWVTTITLDDHLCFTGVGSFYESFYRCMIKVQIGGTVE